MITSGRILPFLVYISVLCFAIPSVSTAQEGGNEYTHYWGELSEAADSAAVGACATLKRSLEEYGTALHEDRFRDTNVIFARNYADFTDRLTRYLGDIEVIRPPASLDLNHQQIQGILQDLVPLHERMGTTAAWATCKLEKERGLACNEPERGMRFTRIMQATGLEIAGLLTQYKQARERIGKQLSEHGVVVDSLPESYGICAR